MIFTSNLIKHICLTCSLKLFSIDVSALLAREKIRKNRSIPDVRKKVLVLSKTLKLWIFVLKTFQKQSSHAYEVHEPNYAKLHRNSTLFQSDKYNKSCTYFDHHTCDFTNWNSTLSIDVCWRNNLVKIELKLHLTLLFPLE